jgi:hypothetical protein
MNYIIKNPHSCANCKEHKNKLYNVSIDIYDIDENHTSIDFNLEGLCDSCLVDCINNMILNNVERKIEIRVFDKSGKILYFSINTPNYEKVIINCIHDIIG